MTFWRKVSETIRIWLPTHWLCQSCLRPAQVIAASGTWCRWCWEIEKKPGGKNV